MIHEVQDMKKMLIILLCVVLSIGGSALAENNAKTHMGTVNMNGMFELHCSLPEAYTLSEIDNTEMQYTGVLSTENSQKPMMYISIAFDDLLAEVGRLNDLDEESLEKIEATFREENEVDISYRETAHGTKLMMVKEIEDGVSFVDFYTIYKGYEVEIVLIPGAEAENQELTEDQIQMVIDFLSDLDFVETAVQQ